MTTQISHLSVRDYQSIGTADLDLGRVNIIIGARHGGKSALLRALNGLITNQTGSDFIRKGAKAASVVVTLSDGTTICWVKTKDTAEYVVAWPDGTTTKYDKLAGAVPEDVQHLLNIHPIDVDNTFKITPQIHEQFDAPLLMLESPGRIARALARTTKLDGIMSAQGRASKDLRKDRDTIKTNEALVITLEERASQLPDMSILVDTLKDAEAIFTPASARAAALLKADAAHEGLLSALEAADLRLPHAGALGDIDAALSNLEAAYKASRQLMRAELAFDAAGRDHTKATHDCADIEQAIHYLLDELDICPVCERTMP